MANKLILIIIVVAIVVGGGAFYGGMKYGESKGSQKGLSQADFQNLRNLSPEERQQRLQQLGASAQGAFNGRTGNNRGGSDFSSGEIIAKDEKSITLKLQNGSTKIVFYATSTEIGKFVSGTFNDLEVGKAVSVQGTTSQDGSVIATSIQMRPAAVLAP